MGLGVFVVAGLVLSVALRAAPPGPETFGKTPTTALELWDAADYLLVTGQPAQAVPYLNQFLKTDPDDATLMQIRDRFGYGSILRLHDYPETRSLAGPMATKMSAAARRHATKPERIARFIADLAGSRQEQDYAVERLREAGPFAIPALVAELEKPGISPEDRSLVVGNMGRLDRSTVPALLAVVDGAGAKPQIAADAVDAIGHIGDPRSIPALTAVAASRDEAAPDIVRDAARRAVERITGRAFDAQPKSPIRLLTDEARRYHLHALKFPGDRVIIWVWDATSEAPVPRTVSRSEAEGYFGMKLAQGALAIDPTDRKAQVVLLSMALEKAIERVGFTKFPAGDSSNTFAAAVAAGPAVLSDVLRTAMADRKFDTAAAAATALGRVTDANAVATTGALNPLVEALSAPGRRARFAAAEALVALDPHRPFAGSSRVVPVLAQFVATQAQPRALVIDGNNARGSQLSGFLQTLGYQPVLVGTGIEGFQAAVDSADIELILIDHHMILGDWRVHDTLANLKADARTAGIPIYVVGPLGREVDLLPMTAERFPGVKFLVTPGTAQLLEQQLAIVGRPSAISDEERTSYATRAAALLAQIAAQPNSPFEPDLARIEPALALALNVPATSLAASAALGDVPDQNAQRGLADTLIDPSKPADLRLFAARQLARSIQRFGPLVAADQEINLLAAFDHEPEPAMRAALASVVGALKPKAAPIGQRLRQLGPGLPADPNANPDPSPTAPPAPPSPEAAPEPAPEAKP